MYRSPRFHDTSSSSSSSSQPRIKRRRRIKRQRRASSSYHHPPPSPQVCVVSYSRTMCSRGYDVLVADLDSLRSAAEVRTTLRLILDNRGCKTSFAFCGLGSMLYMFESEPKMSVFKIDLSPYYSYGRSDLAVRTSVIRRNDNDLRRARDMPHPKSYPSAIPTPDGAKILVFSSLIIFGHSPEQTVGHGDFELYDPLDHTWVTLPGIHLDCKDYMSQHSREDFIRIHAFAFLDASTFFIRTTTKVMFALDLRSPDQGWRKMDTFFGADSPPLSNTPFLVIEDRLCVTPWVAYNIKRKDQFPHWFDFPMTVLAPDVRPATPLVAVLGNDRGKYDLCTLQSGIQKKTGHPQLILNLKTCHLDRYKEKEDEDELKDFAQLYRSMTTSESIKFFLDAEQCRAFFPIAFFSIAST